MVELENAVDGKRFNVRVESVEMLTESALEGQSVILLRNGADRTVVGTRAEVLTKLQHEAVGALTAQVQEVLVWVASASPSESSMVPSALVHAARRSLGWR